MPGTYSENAITVATTFVIVTIDMVLTKYQKSIDVSVEIKKIIHYN